MLVAGATGGVGQLATAKLLEVREQGAFAADKLQCPDNGAVECIDYSSAVDRHIHVLTCAAKQQQRVMTE